MSPSFNSFGSNPSVSQLVWDTDLVIPDGKAIESASGEVGIVGDVLVSGNLITDALTSDTITAYETITSLGDTVINDKPLVAGKNVSNANATLTQIPGNSSSYTSPDFAINGATENVQYIVPPITYTAGASNGFKSTFSIQAKLSDGTYQTLTSITLDNDYGGKMSVTTKASLTPLGAVALRYVISAGYAPNIHQIDSNLTLSLNPNPVY